MAATAAVTRTPPVHSGPNSVNLHARPNTGIPNFGQQDPGLHSTSQDLGPSFHPQHHVSARPIIYVPTPPPPPLLQYQWPMPFSYNPFAGLPGMGKSSGFLFSLTFNFKLQTFMCYILFIFLFYYHHLDES